MSKVSTHNYRPSKAALLTIDPVCEAPMSSPISSAVSGRTRRSSCRNSDGLHIDSGRIGLSGARDWKKTLIVHQLATHSLRSPRSSVWPAALELGAVRHSM